LGERGGRLRPEQRPAAVAVGLRRARALRIQRSHAGLERRPLRLLPLLLLLLDAYPGPAQRPTDDLQDTLVQRGALTGRQKRYRQIGGW